MHDLLLSLAHDAVASSLFPTSELHGEDHWRGVADQALWLGEQQGWDRERRLFLFAFGAAHDSQRINDGYDPEHGQRAADWIVTQQWADRLGITAYEGMLYDALVRHDQGGTSTNPLIGACWDADRSLLGRVGIDPDPSYFSVANHALFLPMTRRGLDVADAPARWADLARRALAA